MTRVKLRARDRRRQRASRRALTGCARSSALWCAGDAGSRDDGCARRREEQSEPASRLGYRSSYYTRTLVTRCGPARVAGAAGSRRPVLDRAFRTLSTLRAGVGGDAGRDIRAGRFDPQGQGDHRGVPAAMSSRPPPSPPSTSAWTKASTPSPDAPSPSLSLTSSSTLVMKRCARAAWSPSQAVLIAVGIDWDGRRRSWLSTSPTVKAAPPGRTSCSDCAGAVFAASSSSSPTTTPACVRPSARFCRSGPSAMRYVHFLRNALDHLPRKADNNCLQELRSLYDRRNAGRGPPRPRRLDHTPNGETATGSLSIGSRNDRGNLRLYYRLPRQSIISVSRAPTCSNGSTRRSSRRSPRRAHLPNASACLRLVHSTLAVETHENWLEAHRYLNMNDLQEHRKPPFAKPLTQPTPGPPFAELTHSIGGFLLDVTPQAVESRTRCEGKQSRPASGATQRRAFRGVICCSCNA